MSGHLESAIVVRATSKTAAKTTATAADVSPVAKKADNDMVLPNFSSILDAFGDLAGKLREAQAEFEKLQKEIVQVRQSWDEEKKSHALALTQQVQQEELNRKRERDSYDWELSRTRKKIEDELTDKKEEFEKDRQELLALRGRVATFDSEIAKSVRDAQDALREEITLQFANEKKLKDQENKAEKDLLSIRVANLADLTARQSKEIEALKKALDEATRQVKEIAVKVIESGGNPSKASQPAEV